MPSIHSNIVRRPLPAGLSTRLTVMALVAVVPALAAILFLEGVDRREDHDRIFANNLRVAHLAAAHYAGTFDGAQRLLMTLSVVPQLRGPDRKACSDILHAVLDSHPGYVNVAEADADGTLFCSGAPMDPAKITPATHQAWFERAIRTRTTALGDVQGSATNGKPAIIVAYPLIDSSTGRIVRVMVATLGLEELGHSVKASDLPANSTLTLFDRRGTIVTRSPHPERYIGKPIPDERILQQMAGDVPYHVSDHVGVDGVRRLFVTVPVAGGLYVGLGVEHSLAFAESDRVFDRFVWLLVFVTLAAIVAGVVGGQALVIRPVAEREREQAEAALRVAEERMRFALEAAGVGVWEVNLRTNKGYWSTTCEKMHGLAPDTFGGTLEAFMECIHPDDRTAIGQVIEQSIRTRSNAELSYRAVWPDGTVRRITSAARFFFDELGPTRGAGIATDVSGHHLLEEQLRQSQKMEAIGQLAGGVAHDFNNLLTVILGNAHFAISAVPPDGPVHHELVEIKNAASRAAELTRQLLAFSRKQILAPKPTDIDELVGRVAPMLGRVIGEDIEFTYTLSGTTPMTMADPAQLEQALINLAVNARDAMPHGGTLRIATSVIELDAAAIARQALELEPGEYVKIIVRDTGIGMSPEVLRRAFEPFFTTKEVGCGTGLGLSSVYGAVKQSGGHVTASSIEGQGATFTIYLARLTDEAVASANASAAPDPRPPMARTILLVEDERAVRDLTHRVLTDAGYTVLSATCGSEAIERALGHGGPIHLVLSDVVMPGMPVDEMVTAIRASHPEVAVLLMSGYSDNEIVRRGVPMRDFVLLEKPFTAPALLDEIYEVLDNARFAKV